MNNADVSSISDSEKMRYFAMYEKMKNVPGFADMLLKSTSDSKPVTTESSQSISDSTEARTESLLTHKESPEFPLKASPINDDEWELMFKNNFLIEERCRSLASQSKFYEAISLLEDLEYDDEPDIGIELLKAECYIQLGRENKAEGSIEKIEKILTTQPACNVNDIMDLADDFNENNNYIQSLLLLRIAGDMFMSSPLSPDDKVGGIFRCIRKMQEPVVKMLKPKTSNTKEAEGLQGFLQSLLGPLSSDDLPALESLQNANQKGSKTQVSERVRVIAFDFGVEVMEEMLEDLRNVKDADLDIIAIKQSILANMINLNYSKSQHTKALKLLKTGLRFFENHFGRNKNQHKVYITTLANIGVELHNNDKYSEAAEKQMQALDEIDNVLDFDDENERQSEIRRIRELLKISRKHLLLA